MGFRGLDWGSGIGQYAQILREADQMRRQQEQQKIQNAMAAQQAAQLYGYNDPSVQFMPMTGMPGMGDQSTTEPVLDMYGEEIAVDPYMDPGVFGREPAMNDAAEADLLSADIAAGQVGQKKNALPQGRPAQGRSSAQDQPPPKGTEYRKGGTQAFTDKDFERAIRQYNKGLGRSPVAPLGEKSSAPDMTALAQVYDNEIKSLLDSAKSTGMVRGGMVHPYIARQIQEIRKQKLEAMKPRAFETNPEYMSLLTSLISANKTPTTGAGRAAVDPVIAMQRKLKILKGQLSPRPQQPESMMMGSPLIQRQYQANLQKWNQENAGILSQMDAIVSSATGAPSQKKQQAPSGKKYKFKGNLYSAEEIKQKFPEVYEKNKSKFGG